MPTIGTCSICGGAVRTPDNWMGMNPPIPTCVECGATAKNPHGSVVEMEKQESRIVDESGLKRFFREIQKTNEKTHS